MDFDGICERFERGADTQVDVQNLILYIIQLRQVVDELEADNKELAAKLEAVEAEHEAVGC